MIKELFDCFGVSGYEKNIRDLIIRRIENYVDEIQIDSMGNLHVKKMGKSNRNIAVFTYMDEPGIIITSITEDGYLRFDTIGRLRPEFLVSKQVLIGDTIGIISLKAIHLTTKKEREVPVKTTELFIDIGAKTKEEAEEIIDIGDYGSVYSPPVDFGNNLLKGHALGSRCGCNIAINILKHTSNCNLHVIFATQREINNRGCYIASKNLVADFVIFLDTVPAKLWNNESYPTAGEGAVVVKRNNSGVIQQNVLEKICNIAKKENINIQFYGGKLDTPDGALKENGCDIASFVLALPIKYSDSPSQVICKNDIKSAENLLSAILTGGDINDI